MNSETLVLTPISVVSVIYLLGASQGCFLTAALVFSKGGSLLANRYLGAFTLVFSLALVDDFLDGSGLTPDYIWLRVLLWPKDFLFGTLFYFYVRELTQPQQYWLKDKQWLHFIPFLIHTLVTWSLFIFTSSRQYNILENTEGLSMPDKLYALLLGDIELFTSIFQVTVYLVLSFRLLAQHQCRINRSFSCKENVSLAWLKILLSGIVVVYFIWLGEELLNLAPSANDMLDKALGLSMVILIYSMGLMGLRQPLIFSKKTFIEQEECKQPTIDTEKNLDDSSKYQNSPISDELGKNLMLEIKQFMVTEKPYLEPKLSLHALATALDIPLNYLSQVINEQSGTNFFDFINQYRIEEAKYRLSLDATHGGNVLTIALESGFNSKSTFYASFKKYTGMTPGKYRKSRQSIA